VEGSGITRVCRDMSRGVFRERQRYAEQAGDSVQRMSNGKVLPAQQRPHNRLDYRATAAPANRERGRIPCVGWVVDAVVGCM